MISILSILCVLQPTEIIGTEKRCEQVTEARLTFETADPKDRAFLVDFAVASNDIYRTRTASIELARQVFDLPSEVFSNDLIEVLKLDDEIIGYYALKEPPFSTEGLPYELSALFVKAGQQGKGLGTLLFRRAVAKARSRGWKKLEWISDPDAEVFYQKMGAAVTGYFENLLNPAVDLPVFTYSLPQDDSCNDQIESFTRPNYSSGIQSINLHSATSAYQ